MPAGEWYCSPFNGSSKTGGRVVPGKPGISLGCCIYARSVTTAGGIMPLDFDPPINQAPSQRRPRMAVEKPYWSSFFHPPGGYDPGFAKIVPQR